MERQLDIIAYLLAKIVGKQEGKSPKDMIAEALLETKNERQTSSMKSNEDLINSIYKLYPTTCPVSGRSTGKCSKNKKQIATLLKEKDAATIERTMRQYVADCKNHNTYFKNFSTFLNQFPDEDSLFPQEQPNQQATPPQPAAPPQKKSPEVIAIEAMHAGVKDASIVIHAIRCVWEGIPEEKVNSALRNAGYIR